MSGRGRTAEVPLAGGIALAGDLTVPDSAAGVVVFAHGSGSSRFSPRNRLVADRLGALGFATLLLDLLTPAEESVDAATRQHRFDIPLLAGRLMETTQWLSTQEVGALPVGYFGASTGAAAALVAAAQLPGRIAAVVSRGGRPDLAGDLLASVQAPTLLVVGGRDDVVLGLNEATLDRLVAERALALVPDATHLFSEPGALEEVARLAGDWFIRHLAGQPPSG